LASVIRVEPRVSRNDSDSSYKCINDTQHHTIIQSIYLLSLHHFRKFQSAQFRILLHNHLEVQESLYPQIATSMEYSQHKGSHGTHPSGASVVLPWLGRRIAGRNSQRRTGPWNPLSRKKVFLCPLDGLMSRTHWQTCNDLYPGL
jgi:hypothetical protein